MIETFTFLLGQAVDDFSIDLPETADEVPKNIKVQLELWIENLFCLFDARYT